MASSRLRRGKGVRRGEVDARIEYLHEEKNYTIPEICKELGVGSKRACAVIKRYEESKKPAEVSKRSKSFEFFKNGIKIGNKSLLLDAAINLDLSPEEVKNYFHEWLDICGLDQLRELFINTEGMVGDFLSFYNECKRLEIDPVTVSELLPSLHQIPAAEKKLADLIDLAESERTSVHLLYGKKQELSIELHNLKSDLKSKTKELEDLEEHILDLKKVEKAYSDSDFHKEVRQIVFDEVKKFYEAKNIQMLEARVAITNVVRKNPEFRRFFDPQYTNLYDWNLETKFRNMFEKSLQEGHCNMLEMAMPATMDVLCKSVDDLHKNDRPVYDAEIEFDSEQEDNEEI